MVVVLQTFYQFPLISVVLNDTINPSKLNMPLEPKSMLLVDYSPLIMFFLFLQVISHNDQGIYSCYSKGLDKDDIKIHKVSLLVRKDLEDVYEHDHDVSPHIL